MAPAHLPTSVTFGVNGTRVVMIASHEGITQVANITPDTARLWARQLTLLADSIDRSSEGRAPAFKSKVLEMYEGTRLGKLEAEKEARLQRAMEALRAALVEEMECLARPGPEKSEPFVGLVGEDGVEAEVRLSASGESPEGEPE